MCLFLKKKRTHPLPFLTSWQKIQAEISAHELTLEELRRNLRSQPPTSPDGRTTKGGSQMDVLQVRARCFPGKGKGERVDYLGIWYDMNHGNSY
jgi:hypothetical protein